MCASVRERAEDALPRAQVLRQDTNILKLKAGMACGPVGLPLKRTRAKRMSPAGGGQVLPASQLWKWGSFLRG